MPGDSNVRTLRPAGGGDDSSAELEVLAAAVRALDEIADGFERIEPSPHWSSARWSAASMPFCMRLIPAKQQLAALRRIDSADWPDVGWSMELARACTDFEQELQAAVGLLDMLLREEVPPGERAWQSQRFTAGGKGFREALTRLREVIVGRYPEAGRPS